MLVSQKPLSIMFAQSFASIDNVCAESGASIDNVGAKSVASIDNAGESDAFIDNVRAVICLYR